MVIDFAYKLLLLTLNTCVIQVIFCNVNGKQEKKGLKISKYLIDISISYMNKLNYQTNDLELAQHWTPLNVID